MDLDIFLNVRPMKDHLGLVSEFLEARGTKPDMEITSMPALNRKIWGIGRKKLTLIGARPSNGKSALVMQLAFDISATHRVLVLSLEQTIEETIERMFCNAMGVSNVELLKGGFGRYKPQWDIFCDMVKRRRMIITETIGKTWREIDELISTMEEFPDLIIIDYVQCISTRGINKLEVIDEYILHLRNLAIEFNFGVLMCSQINRQNVGVDNNEPTLAGLKSSGFLEELADKALLLHWEAHQKHTADLNKFKIIIAKNKGGLTGYVNCKFEPQFYRFSDDQTGHKAVDEERPGTLEEVKEHMDMFKAQSVKVTRRDIDG